MGTNNKKKEKIVILGGGMAALTTAFALTRRKDWQDRFESITIYQLGWRLGGKGASGRGVFNRIQEHGLHLWLGFYEEAFQLIQECYVELNRPPSAPLARWDEAFKKANFVALADRYAEEWQLWTVMFPEDSRTPGSPSPHDPMLTVWYYVKRAMALMIRLIESSEDTENNDRQPAAPHSWWDNVRRDLAHGAAELEAALNDMTKLALLREALAFAEMLDEDAARHRPEQHAIFLSFLSRFREQLREDIRQQSKHNVAAWRIYSICELCLANIRGIFADGVLLGGFAVIDQYEYRSWLKHHEAPAEVVDQSAVLKGIYDLAFAYQEGNVALPAFAADVALCSICRIFFAYKGAIFWKMQAGMGDVVFAPLYLVLRQRGVRFRFFHRVKNLCLSHDKKSIASVEIARQVDVRDSANEYQPLIEVNGLPCWPAEPLYHQLVQGDQLQELSQHDKQATGYNLYNLESFWTKWKDVGEVTLCVGEDFDRVILGVSLASLRALTQDLLTDENNPKWKLMIENVSTVQTQAFQLWLSEDMEQLGWTLPQVDLSGYVHPFDTWADMRQLIARESWPAEEAPKSIAYFCTVMPTPHALPPPEDQNFPVSQGQQVKANVIAFLQQYLGTLWPQAVRNNGFRWDLLVGGDNTTGEQRFDSQYWRANIDPSEHYVQSIPGSSRFRLQADASGYDNLYLVGDWIDSGFNVGCIEAAVIAGLAAASAIGK